MLRANDNQPEWFAGVPRGIAFHTVLGCIMLVGAFGGFGAWAFSAPLAAAVIAPGSFVATGQNKVVQHLEGGIIEEILVEEGAIVEKGQAIVKLDETSALAKDRQLWLRHVRLEAINARLQAEYGALETINFPPMLTSNRGDFEVSDILDSQQLNFEGARAKLEAEIALLTQNKEALDFRAEGYRKQMASVDQQLGLLKEELEGKLFLLDKGYINKVQVTALKRAIAEAEGQIGRLSSEVDETVSQSVKYDQQVEQVLAAYRQAALEELQAIEAELDTVREERHSTSNILKRATIPAPVEGTIVRLYYHTAGGVIESGRPIAEITPANVPLIVEVQIPRTDIDSVEIGQEAMVRLSALNQRTTPVLMGEVFYISADAIPDTTSGVQHEIYIVRVKLASSELSRVRGFAPTPGMPAEIMIQTAERTFFEYIAKPVVDSMSRAFREN
ncbi:HlyD family type I secretion periplasmic adaptor subunit [Fulvimarina sp. 2208YS6-2-32]|uniref:Membrane fusion protein (MFP) family protein n=1 Tax=Fulvimarina uroteuthidis TaxID=3098149 RepID=A0ABU5I5Z1_9HYPH|nr:HlyD family type I secretion periplasmic adaptor subunit [Fulvimarina sp. 2208YS6-2-32]MDY8110794.1 HlyD family type I secretion periplasmic adaptor subunit [Fulvimarina sp. 2208YS6-2-32]